MVNAFQKYNFDLSRNWLQGVQSTFSLTYIFYSPWEHNCLIYWTSHKIDPDIFLFNTDIRHIKNGFQIRYGRLCPIFNFYWIKINYFYHFAVSLESWQPHIIKFHSKLWNVESNKCLPSKYFLWEPPKEVICNELI